MSFTLPYLTLPYITLPYLNLPYLTLPYLTLPYLTLPYLTLPYLTLPYITLPYLIWTVTWAHTVIYSTLLCIKLVNYEDKNTVNCQHNQLNSNTARARCINNRRQNALPFLSLLRFSVPLTVAYFCQSFSILQFRQYCNGLEIWPEGITLSRHFRRKFFFSFCNLLRCEHEEVSSR